MISELSRRIGAKVRVFSSASLSAGLKMIAEGIAVGPYTRALEEDLLESGQIVEFDPGFAPRPLEFTAYYLSEPSSFVFENSAEIAREVALAWDRSHPK